MEKKGRELLFSVPDITIAEYFGLDELSALRYDIYINTLKPSNVFCGKFLDTSKLTYEQVELIRLTFKAPTIDEVKDLFLLLWGIRGNMKDSAERMFLNESIFQLFRAKNYVYNFITKTIDKEIKMLSSAVDVKAQTVNAGERLAPVNYILTKNKLAERFGCMPKDIAKMKYSEIFLILLSDKMYADVSHDYNQVK